MKKIFGIAFIATAMIACNTNPQPATTVTTTTVAPDTTGFAQYQALKAQNELPVTTNATSQNVATTQQVRRTTAPVKRSSHTHHSTNSSGSSGNMSSSSSNTAQTPQKKGWSKAAKGAVIGGVTGGVAGAIINKKNRAVGGVVGAVIGAGGGYVIGKKMDKKDGRNQ